MACISFSTEFLASQIAGSCRIEGIKITSHHEQMVRDVIDGKVDAGSLIAQMVLKHKVTPSN